MSRIVESGPVTGHLTEAAFDMIEKVIVPSVGGVVFPEAAHSCSMTYEQGEKIIEILRDIQDMVHDIGLDIQ